MKKSLSLLVLCALIAAGVAGCGNGSGAKDGSAGESSAIDVDLTVLSSTMVFAEMNHIMSSPDEYIGKRIKMSGPYYASYYDQTGSYYHYVIVEDAAECCVQGIEFVWNGDHAYPDDYPEDKAVVEVIGVFGSYSELGLTYYYLEVDDLVVL